MAFWNKKKKEDEKKTDKASKAEYKIVIKEKFGNATSTLRTIKAERYIDAEDYVVYLRNEQEKFMELFPQDENDLEQLDKTTIKAQLTKARTELKKEKLNDTEGINDSNLEFTIMKCEAKLRAMNFGKDDPYITIDEVGVKVFYFLREGSTFHPFKWDTDTRTIYTASDNKKKKAGIARKNKALELSLVLY